LDEGAEGCCRRAVECLREGVQRERLVESTTSDISMRTNFALGVDPDCGLHDGLVKVTGVPVGLAVFPSRGIEISGVYIWSVVFTVSPVG
jgi:hypothetical protein